MSEVDRHTVDSLGSLVLLGEGGEAEVFECASHPNMVFKRFRPSVTSEISPQGLVDTIALLAKFSVDDLAFVRRRTVWPRAMVIDEGNMVGYLMDRIGGEYFCRHGRKDGMQESATDWNKLAYRDRVFANPNLASTMVNMSAPGRADDLRKLLRDVSRMFELMHGHGIVVGDVSGRNLMWTCDPRPEVLLIDCDGFRASGERAVTTAKQSPDWVDPTTIGDTTVQSDLYKLSLAVFRGYFSAEVRFPDEHSPSSSDAFGAELLELARRGTSAKDRTTAAEWVKFFDRWESQKEEQERQARVSSRPRIDWTKDVDSGPPPIPTGERSVPREPMDWRNR